MQSAICVLFYHRVDLNFQSEKDICDVYYKAGNVK